MSAELVAIDRRVTKTEVRLDAVPRARPGVAIVLDQVELH